MQFGGPLEILLKGQSVGQTGEWMGDIPSCDGLKGNARKVQRSPGQDE